MKFSKYISKAVTPVMALFQKQHGCLSNKATTICGYSVCSLLQVPVRHNRGGKSNENKVRFAPPTMCRLTYCYLFTYGYKKQLYPIKLTFSLEDYPHLAGFQYTKDISLPNYSSAKIADRILEGKISFEKVQEAAQYEEMIKPRLEALVHLKGSLNNEFNLYSYMPQMYPFITGIKADYLISSHFSVDNFIFIIKANSQGELKCDFLCCSIFEKGERDYETNQRPRTLMKKERIHIPTNTTDILLDRLAKQLKAEDTNNKIQPIPNSNGTD